MSCPHGEWHEEDCEICQKDNQSAGEIDRLEAELAKTLENWAIETQQFKAVDLLRQAAEAALAERDRMLRLACEDLSLNLGPYQSSNKYLADLRTRAEEGSRGQ